VEIYLQSPIRLHGVVLKPSPVYRQNSLQPIFLPQFLLCVVAASVVREMRFLLFCECTVAATGR